MTGNGMDGHCIQSQSCGERAQLGNKLTFDFPEGTFRDFGDDSVFPEARGREHVRNIVCHGGKKEMGMGMGRKGERWAPLSLGRSSSP